MQVSEKHALKVGCCKVLVVRECERVSVVWMMWLLLSPFFYLVVNFYFYLTTKSKGELWEKLRIAMHFLSCTFLM